LPITGDIYVAASINSRASGGSTVAEYQIQSSSNNGISWSDLGKPVKRSMFNTYDDGIISLVGCLKGQNSGNYLFRIVHRRVSGLETVTTNNANLVAVALAHNGGSYFPSFYSEVGSLGVGITGVSTSAIQVTSSSFTSLPAIGGNNPGLFVNAQYLVSASGLDTSINPEQRMRARNQLFLDDGTTLLAADAYLRYIGSNTAFGSGGFIGIAENLIPNTSYTVSMKHDVADISNADTTEDETLTTSEVILTGFQTFDKPSPTLSTHEELLSKGLTLFSRGNKVILQSRKLIDAKIKIYNILGQLIAEDNFKNQDKMSVNVNYKGITIVSVELTNGVFSKKILL
jgi:hypothetical protein